MGRIRRFSGWWLVVAACLWLVGCGDDEEQTPIDGGDTDVDEISEVEEVAKAPLDFDPAGPDAAPDPYEAGPFPVGVMTFDFYDDSRPDELRDNQGRWLRVDVWYPATQDYKDGPFEKMDLKKQAEDIDLGDKQEIIANADLPLIQTVSARDAEIEPTHGPYPVILFSHGANGIRWQSVFYTQHLASHGYIVISPDHDHNTIWDIIRDGFQGDSLLSSLTKRPDDMSFLLDRAVEWNRDETSVFYGLIDEENVGVTGHSLGGITSTIMPCKDPRFKAAVLHSPSIAAGYLYGVCDLEDYPVPTLTMGGTLDDTLPYCGMYCDYKNMLLSTQPKYLYELEAGGHFTFSDICRLDLIAVSQELDMGNDAKNALSDGCADFNAPFEDAQKTINYYATAFFNLYLRDSEGSDQYLEDRDDAPFDVVNFFTGDVPDYWGEGGCEACEGI